MDLSERISSFVELGKKLKKFIDSEAFGALCKEAGQINAWFTPELVNFSFNAVIENYLDAEKLNIWINRYVLKEGKKRKIGVIMAGNIPLAGFHDFLSVLITGNDLKAKLSSDDKIFLPLIASMLTDIQPGWKGHVEFVDKIETADAIIATGSDNTSRYFEFEYGNIKHIIRQNRTSYAILNGSESENDLLNLSQDILLYFGLGCRNVSKLFVPENFDPAIFQNIFSKIHISLDKVGADESFFLNHQKYYNNYLYQKAILKTQNIDFTDLKYLLLQREEKFVSPLSVVYYQNYKNVAELEYLISAHTSKTQCLVSKNGHYPQSVPFGMAQKPELWDYADNMDTINFLNSLN